MNQCPNVKEEMVPNSCVKSKFLYKPCFFVTFFTIFGSIYDFYDFRNYILVEALSLTYSAAQTSTSFEVSGI
jgi:hypothetical protein